MGMHDVHGVKASVGESVHHAIDQLRGILRRRTIAEIGAIARDLAADVAVVTQSLSTDDVQFDLHTIALELREKIAALSDEVRVERTRQAAIGGDEQDRGAPNL